MSFNNVCNRKINRCYAFDKIEDYLVNFSMHLLLECGCGPRQKGGQVWRLQGNRIVTKNCLV
jgi:hypothetical protein